MMWPDFQQFFEGCPGCFLVLAPDSPRFTILAATDAYLQATRTRRGEIIGQALFDDFPDNPNDPKRSRDEGVIRAVGSRDHHVAADFRTDAR